jgi:hypothetical protein
MSASFLKLLSSTAAIRTSQVEDGFFAVLRIRSGFSADPD